MNKIVKNTQPTNCSTYRHGDLYCALLESAVQLASKGGADAVILREVTRQAGVAPNAAYRHFADHNALYRQLAWPRSLRLPLQLRMKLLP